MDDDRFSVIQITWEIKQFDRIYPLRNKMPFSFIRTWKNPVYYLVVQVAYKITDADKSLARPGRKQAIFPSFRELGGSLPHSQGSTLIKSIHSSTHHNFDKRSFFPSRSGWGLISTPIIALIYLLLLCLCFRNSSVLAKLGHYLSLERRSLTFLCLIYIWKPRSTGLFHVSL